MKKPPLNKKIFKQGFFNESAFGWDGLTTFVFSNVLLLSTFGIGFFYLFFKVIKIAMATKTYLPEAKRDLSTLSNEESSFKAILIAGLRLENNQPIEEYIVRLKRAVSLLNDLKNKPVEYQLDTVLKTQPKLIILGGLTGNNQISEAQAGAHYLQAQGIDAGRIILEDKSRHTLENLQQARMLLFVHQLEKYEKLSESIAIISSRYHLYRVLTLAKGLQMTLQPIAAEESFSFSFVMILRALKEAYFLHWYWSGKLWVFITANRKSKARIT